jgi:ribosomal protein S8
MVATLTDLVKTYSHEAWKIQQLTLQVDKTNEYQARSNVGEETWTSESSGYTYSTVAGSPSGSTIKMTDANVNNKGTDGLLFMLSYYLTHSISDGGWGNVIITASYLASLITAMITGELTYAEDSGASDSYAVALPNAPSAYVSGMVVNFKANTANTGACSLNVNALGAVAIKNVRGADLQTGEILSGQEVSVIHNGTYFIMLSQPATYMSPIISNPTLRLWDGWQDANEQWTYASATTFTVSGDVTSKYQKGDKLKWTQNGAVRYNNVIAVPSFNAGTGLTTIMVHAGYISTAGDSAILDTSTYPVTLNYYSKTENPQGWPYIFNYVPTVTAGSGAYASVSGAIKFIIRGIEIFIVVTVNIENNGTAGTYCNCTLPINADSGIYMLAGREDVSTGIFLQGRITTNSLQIFKYDNSYVGSNGYSFKCSGTYLY